MSVAKAKPVRDKCCTVGYAHINFRVVPQIRRMTTVDKETEKGRDAQNRVPGKRAKAELVGIFLLCLLLSIFVSVRKTQEIMERNDLHIVHMDQHAQHLPVRTVGTEPLKHEDMFLETIKSCLPESNKNCKLFIPEHTTAQRVAVIAPPGDLAEAFLQLIQFVIGKAQRRKKVEVELFPTTHIPPYGYGKTQ